MKSWKMRGAAALAVLSLAIAGCQQQGDDTESLDTLPSIEAPSMDASMDMGSQDASAGESEDSSDLASPSDDS